MNTAVNLLLSIVLTTRWGVSGAVWGSVISYAAVAAVPSFLIVASAIRRRESEAAL
jgi:O-antigen/teichoic acid export membrane protein